MESNLYFVDLENALSEFETIRADILKKLEIEYVQKKIKRKIQKEESSEIEILFYKEEQVSDEEMDSMSSFLTDSLGDDDDILHTNSLGDDDDILHTNSLGDDDDILHTNSLGDDEINNENKNKNKNININEKHIINSEKYGSKFIDLEAECSDDSYFSEDGEGEVTDLEDFVAPGEKENVVNKRLFDLLRANKEKEDDEEIKNLKKKFIFSKRKKMSEKRKRKKCIEFDTIINSDDVEIPKIEEFNIECLESMEICTETKKEKENLISNINNDITVNNDINISFEYEIFNDNELALEKLLKREDTFSGGFFQNNEK